MNKRKIKELIEYIKSEDWIDYSCGRSTDYVDEFWAETSIENIINKIKELDV